MTLIELAKQIMSLERAQHIVSCLEARQKIEIEVLDPLRKQMGIPTLAEQDKIRRISGMKTTMDYAV